MKASVYHAIMAGLFLSADAAILGPKAPRLKKINRDWFFQSKQENWKKSIDFSWFLKKSIEKKSIDFYAKNQSIFVLKINRFVVVFFFHFCCFGFAFSCTYAHLSLYTSMYTYVRYLNIYIQNWIQTYIDTLIFLYIYIYIQYTHMHVWICRLALWYTHMHIYIYIYIYVYIYVCFYIYLYLFIHLFLHCTYLFTYVYIYIHIYILILISKYTYKYIYIYMYIYIYSKHFMHIYRGYPALRLKEFQRLPSPKIEGKWGYPAQRFKEFEGP